MLNDFNPSDVFGKVVDVMSVAFVLLMPIVMVLLAAAS